MLSRKLMRVTWHFCTIFNEILLKQHEALKSSLKIIPCYVTLKPFLHFRKLDYVDVFNSINKIKRTLINVINARCDRVCY